MFITRGLERILADRDIKRSYNQQLKKACESTLAEIRNESASPTPSQSSALPQPREESKTFDEEKYFVPFELACLSKSKSIVIISLDCIQKLIAYGHFTGNKYDSRYEEGQLLIDTIVSSICNCFTGPTTDDNVQLQIIKALLTIVTSQSCAVHESSILLVVRTCYNIYLASKNLVNQTTAKATLTQMLNVIFSRMESFSTTTTRQQQPQLQQSKQNGPTAGGATAAAAADSQLPNTSCDTLNDNSFKTGDSQAASSAATATAAAPLPLHSSHSSNQLARLNNAISDHQQHQHHLQSTYEKIRKATSDSVEDVVTDLVNTVCYSENGGNSGGGSEQLPSPPSLEASQQQPSSTSSTISKPSHPPPTTRTPSLSTASSAIISSDSFESNDTIHLVFDNIYQKDAYLVFRSLCKLSMKPLSDTLSDMKSHELRSKVLSLQLILQILQNSGPVFQNSDMFAVAIKQYLCVALSKNGVSNIPEIFELSLAIFLALIQKFKTYLKMQIEVFFKEIFLNILETVSSSFEHKWKVIQALTRICADAQSVVDIYVNYDCDLSSENIFGRLVNDVARIAQGGGHSDHSTFVTAAQERSMRLKGLECLVSILKCMVEWSNDLYVNPQQQVDQTIENSGNATTTAGSNASAAKDGDGSGGGSNSLHETNSINNLDRVSLNNLNNENNDSDNPEKFEEVKQTKNIIDRGIDLFNINPKKGLKYLQHHGILEEKAESIAHFFHSTDRLDKSLVGEYMGDFAAFNKEVMYAYVDQMDFSSKDIVVALRFFLEGFRLPGEAQKIDRFMEKFASRFFQTNMHTGIFASADAAYVLAYSIIMLTTDLHSPQVKRKMTKEDYIKMNRGINESKDLPEEYLSQIYDEIAESEIKMRGSHHNKVKVRGNEVASEKARRLLYNMEMETMATAAKALMESVSHVESPFTSAKHLDHVRPMFRTAWTSFLSAFSVGLQDCDDTDIASCCLDGLRCAIRIACIFQMDLERDAFVQALARFTLLNANGPIVEMKTKNLDTIKTLIMVANTDGNYLGKSWLDILRCISQLELAQLIGTGVKPQVLNNNHLQMNTTASVAASVAAASSSNGSAFGGFQFKLESFVPLAVDSLARGSKEKEMSRISESIIEASSQSVVVAVDRIFTGSVKLDGNAIVDFVKALCKVSSEELANVSSPRMYSLQKLVEISYYNMSRIRLQWSRIWAILGEHFNKVGCNPNEEIAFFAIDSLRQLSMKFIEKGEFSNFRFQKDFLRPFEHIMKLNSSIAIRDMVVRCIAQMVNSQASNIKSGWKNIFSVFRIAASENDSYIFDLAFQTTCNIFNNIYESNFISMIDSFQDAVKCLSEFGCNQAFPDTSMEAIRLIRACARYVAEQPQYFKEFNIEDKNNGFLASEDDRVWVRGWLPILFELSCIVNICKLDVRTRALTVMFEIIKSHGATFRENWWADLFKIIFRIFDSLKLPGQQSEKNEWMATTCNHALYSIVDVFTQYYDMLGAFLLKDVYSQLFWCVQQDSEQLARSGINCFENLVISCGVKYDPPTWTMTIEFIERIYDIVRPTELLEAACAAAAAAGQSSLSRGDLERLKVKFLVQLDLIQAIDNIVFYPSASRKQDTEILGELERELEERNIVQSYAVGRGSRSSTLSGSAVSASAAAAVNANSVGMTRMNSVGSSGGGPGGDSNGPAYPSSSSSHSGMYVHMSTAALLRLGQFLVAVFEQANRLHLDKSKTKVLLADSLGCLSAQEIKSLLSAIRIFFSLYVDSGRQQCWEEIELELIGTCSKALKCYYEIENEYHRENWNTILILILHNISKLPLDKFQVHMKAYYGLLCDLILLDLKPTLKVLIRRILLRLGTKCLQINDSA